MSILPKSQLDAIRKRAEDWTSKPEGRVSNGQLEDSKTILSLVGHITDLERRLAIADAALVQFDCSASYGEETGLAFKTLTQIRQGREEKK